MAFYSPPATSSPPPPEVSKVEHLLEEVTHRLQQVYQDKAILHRLKDEYLSKLETVSGLSREQARQQVLEEAQNYFAADLAKIIEQAVFKPISDNTIYISQRRFI